MHIQRFPPAFLLLAKQRGVRRPPGRPGSARLQVRCLAVCRSWRRALDPPRFLLDAHTLAAQGGPEDSNPVAAWFSRAQPAVRSITVVVAATLGWDTAAVSTLYAAVLSLQRKVGAARQGLTHAVLGAPRHRCYSKSPPDPLSTCSAGAGVPHAAR